MGNPAFFELKMPTLSMIIYVARIDTASSIDCYQTLKWLVETCYKKAIFYFFFLSAYAVHEITKKSIMNIKENIDILLTFLHT